MGDEMEEWEGEKRGRGKENISAIPTILSFLGFKPVVSVSNAQVSTVFNNCDNSDN